MTLPVLWAELMHFLFGKPWQKLNKPSVDVVRIERMLVRERELAERAGANRDALGAYSRMIYLIRSGRYTSWR